MKKPLLSICIPTYNRAKYLELALESIVSQKVFFTTHDVEIVIVDNCSDDNTASVVKKYADLFPEKIIYVKNSSNIGADRNFEKALSSATGSFLKLHNDTLLMKKDVLSEIVYIIKNNAEDKPIVFFLNGNSKQQEKITACKNLNEFVSHVSYFSSWIGGFGIWQDDFKKIPDFSRNYKLQLVQADVLFRLLATGKQAVVCNKNYFICEPLLNKPLYNLVEVFGQNYLSLYKEYLDNGVLDNKVFQKEKKRLLTNHIIPLYFNFKYKFKRANFFYFMKDYKDDYFFYTSLIIFPAFVVKRKLSGYIRNLCNIIDHYINAIHFN